MNFDPRVAPYLLMRCLKYFLLAIMVTCLCVTPPFKLGILPAAANHQISDLKISQSQISNLVDRGQAFYEHGKLSEAIKVLKKANSEFKVTGDSLKQAMTLSNLSLVYQDLGKWEEAKIAIAQSFQLLENIKNNLQNNTSQAYPQIYAQALDIQGRLKLFQGEASQAIETWKKAAKIYSQLKFDSELIRNQINQAQAMQSLGLFIRARNTLTQVKSRLEQQPDSFLVATGLCNLGDVLRVIGDKNQSREILEQSLALVKRLGKTTNQNEITIQSEILIGLGNTALAQEDTSSAIAFYQQAANVPSTKPIVALKAKLNQLKLLVENLGNNNLNTAAILIPQIQSQIKNLQPSRDSVYCIINFAQSLKELNQKFSTNTSSQSTLSQNTPSQIEIARLLSIGVQQATNLSDNRALSYALGTLGELYEETDQLPEAQKLTQQALDKAIAINAGDISFQWESQLGRLLRKQENISQAIKFYERSWETLKSLRTDLVAFNLDAQFSFRENIEPIYREYADLLLNEKETSNNLTNARQVIESLQLAELDNFFRSACLQTKVVLDDVVDKQDQTAAIIYPIILPERLEVILKLPQKSLLRYTTAITQTEFENTVEQLRSDIEELKIGADPQAKYQTLYKLLLGPAEKYLSSSHVKTLVFVLDGSLRNLPMAALYDGQQYLIEKYNVAMSLGLELFELKRLPTKNLQVITAGLSEERHNFPKLDYVEKELEEIKSQVSGKVLLNQEFTSKTVQKQFKLQSFPIVHFATHGQFSSDPDETFILAYDRPIEVNELNKWLRNREEIQADAIELLVLSACETASGDKKAALGLAGVAIQAGARSTVASLWALNDASTAQLMGQFYKQLTKSYLSKAEALRNAQLSLLQQEEYQVPYFWAPYVLIGNWL